MYWPDGCFSLKISPTHKEAPVPPTKLIGGNSYSLPWSTSGCCLTFLWGRLPPSSLWVYSKNWVPRDCPGSHPDWDCLKIKVGMALLVKDSNEVNLEQKLIIVAPHAVESFLGYSHPSSSQIGNKYYSHLLPGFPANWFIITFPQLSMLNPFSMLSDSVEESLHVCILLVPSFQNIRTNLTDVPGHKLGGIVVIILRKKLWTKVLLWALLLKRQNWLQWLWP